MEENIQASQSVQKPAGSLVWHVVTMLVTNMVVGGAVYLPFLLISIGVFGGNLSEGSAGILDIVFTTIGVFVAIALGSAYLLTKYDISSEVAQKITHWVTGLTAVSVVFNVAVAQSPLQIISPLVYVGAVYLALTMSFGQYRVVLQSFSNMRVRLIEGLIVLIGIVSFVVGMTIFAFNGTLVDFVNNSPLVSEQDRAEFNEILVDSAELSREYAEIEGSLLQSDLDLYFMMSGGKFPESLDDPDFLEKRTSNILSGDKNIDVSDYVYTLSEDKQSYNLCLASDANTCWEGSAPDLAQ